jgi:hypothetical protein
MSRVFYVNPAIIAVPIALLAMFYRPQAVKESLRSQLRSMDIIGTLLITISIASTLYGTLAGGQIQPWKSPIVISTLLFGGTCSCVFVFHQWRIGDSEVRRPLMPFRFLRHRTAKAGFLTSFLHGICLITYSSFYLLFVGMSVICPSSLAS